MKFGFEIRIMIFRLITSFNFYFVLYVWEEAFDSSMKTSLIDLIEFHFVINVTNVTSE